jgi:predicted amidohydrolase YtcJ
MTKGSTAAGKPADLAGLSKNILGNLAEEIQNMNVDVTFF